MSSLLAIAISRLCISGPAASVLQPLDCGIIRSFKAHYGSKLVGLCLHSDTSDGNEILQR